MNKSTNILPSFLKVLIYFDVFRYPLTIIEMKRMVPENEEADLELELEKLIKTQLIFKDDNLYGLNEDKKYFTERRKGNTRAEKHKEKAFKRAKFISKFPYVRGVFISGSFSKGHMLPDGDVDYFIVTEHNRMWFSRTILILFKKLFLFNSRKFFCLNYFKGQQELMIEEQNIFTATELFTLIPVVNKELYKSLIQANNWIEDYFAISKIPDNNAISLIKGLLQSIGENIFNNKIGENLDEYFMKITLNRWKNKFGNMTKQDFDIAMKSSRNISKHHPSNFQKKVLSEYETKCKSMISEYAKRII